MDRQDNKIICGRNKKPLVFIVKDIEDEVIALKIRTSRHNPLIADEFDTLLRYVAELKETINNGPIYR